LKKIESRLRRRRFQHFEKAHNARRVGDGRGQRQSGVQHPFQIRMDGRADL
jgi:hypothetical protein